MCSRAELVPNPAVPDADWFRTLHACIFRRYVVEIH